VAQLLLLVGGSLELGLGSLGLSLGRQSHLLLLPDSSRTRVLLLLFLLWLLLLLLQLSYDLS